MRRWYVVEYPHGGYDVACVDCWDQAQAEAVQAGVAVHSTTDVAEPFCCFCGAT